MMKELKDVKSDNCGRSLFKSHLRVDGESLNQLRALFQELGVSKWHLVESVAITSALES